MAPSGGRRIDFDDEQPSKVRLLTVTAPQPDGTARLRVRLAVNRSESQITSLVSRLQNYQLQQRRWVASHWDVGELPKPLQKYRVAGKPRGQQRRGAAETRAAAATATELAQLAPVLQRRTRPSSRC